jgi:hypothetical protein
MRRKVSVPLAMIAAVAGAFGCSNPKPTEVSGTVADLPASFTQSLAGGPRVYVFDRIDQQTTSPIVLFDHICGADHWVMLSYDSLTLSPNGEARRSSVLTRVTNGVVTNGQHMVATGRWSRFTRMSYYYYSDGPSIEVALAPEAPSKSSP